MFNRIRISTSLFLLLMTFCVLQLASSGLSYSAFRSDNHNLDIITLGSQQRDSLSLSWVSLLQARNTLNRAGTRAALKLPQEQVNELMSSARSSLQKADLYFNQFMAVERSSEQQSQQTATTKASYERLRGTLRELIGFPEKGSCRRLWISRRRKPVTCSKPTSCSTCSWSTATSAKPETPTSSPSRWRA